MGAILTGVGQCHSMNICTGIAATLSGVQAAGKQERRGQIEAVQGDVGEVGIINAVQMSGHKLCTDVKTPYRCQDSLKNLAMSAEAAAAGYIRRLRNTTL